MYVNQNAPAANTIRTAARSMTCFYTGLGRRGRAMLIAKSASKGRDSIVACSIEIRTSTALIINRIMPFILCKNRTCVKPRAKWDQSHSPGS
jgi:hypothetical protein